MKERERMRFLRGVGLAYYAFLQKTSETGERLYGVRITLHSKHGREAAECYVTANRKTAERFFLSVKRGCVTPCTLTEIADEQVF